LNEPINWDEIEDFEGDIHDLSYDYVWDSGNEGNTCKERVRERGEVVVTRDACKYYSGAYVLG
jgi:hypothetical protein